MYVKNIEIVFQEVPDEISISFSVAGCQLRCEGCHSTELWTEKGGQLLTTDLFLSILKENVNLASCVLFLGGEWREDELVEFLQLAKDHKYKTCLYTGLDDVSDNIKSKLTFLKTGRWTPTLGGLNSITTNQKFIDVESGEILNHLFRK